MATHITTADVESMASATHVRAARLSHASSVLGWWHERKFVAEIDDFTRALRSLSQRAIEHATDEEIREIGAKMDAIIADAEVFIGRHDNSSLKRVERDRHLVTRIYELRASFEKIAHGVTAQHGMTDLRWKVKLDTAHRNES
ncbi:MAG: hypothetical protein FJW21_09305 [Acidimicrobiia bacterium]|nr:hypothetical protein [Acidimicrobiia bacterium]